MIIKFIDIKNFRKLKCCRINFSEKETLFVGANNSGKTSAMDALITFLSQKGKNDGSHDDSGNKNQKFSSRDFTLSNWEEINKFGESWLMDDSPRLGETISDWQVLCPSIDVWISVRVEEVDKVTHLIPTLKWSGGELGVRLIYQPKNKDKAEEQSIETLKEKYLLAYKAANELLENHKQPLSLWPTSLHDYLNKELDQHFEIKAYILDPSKISANKIKPQVLTNDQTPLEFYPFHGLFKVSVIEAQRGFSDPNSSHNNSNKNSNLSTQLNDYYSRHLNPTELPDEDDLEALQAIDVAKASFDERLNQSFKGALDEIKQLGYPGFNDPDIKLSSKVNPIESLDHEASVLFEIQKQDYNVDNPSFSLPEKYNGLGYKNLIFMIFKLISFRDQWMRKGKASKRRADSNIKIEPLHLVLIEEPEVHLHAQVQQIFIKKAYDVLRKDILDYFSTQLIVSSHSSYLAHEVNFEKLRYFKRKPAKCNKLVPYSNVVDLSKVFGDPTKRKPKERQTVEFVARYLKITHFDLFFANGIIMVEGAAERMLIPHFINTHFNQEKGLSSSYISILEVGGAHAHRLKPLIESLGLFTLVITDTDAVGSDKKKTRPLEGKGYCSGSDTLKKWFEWEEKTLDEILAIPFEDKIKGKIRAAYQYAIPVVYSEGEEKQDAIPYTFEDAIALTNIELIRDLPETKGMLTKMKEALKSDSLDECCEKLFKALDKGKAEMALDLLFYANPKELKVPKYIEEGLEWLQSELENASNDYESLSEEVHKNESN